MENNTLLEDFERFLLQKLPCVQSIHPYFEEALHYTLQAGGKRFRPLLLLCIVKSKNKFLIPHAMHVACAIEVLHTYSLIHDDLPCMDNAALRRNNPTLHTKFDETTAVLIGDALNTFCFELIASAPLSDAIKIKIIQIIAKNGGAEGMILGQAIDCFFEKTKLPLQDLEFLHINKTAKLIAASLQVGATIVNLPHKTSEMLYDFGIRLGLLFQIQDDIIDACCDDLTAGKTTQNDSNKNSFVTLLGLEETNKYANIIAKECAVTIKKFEKPLSKKLKNLLDPYLYRHHINIC